MSTQAERIVRIEHEDGRRYAVSEYTYKHTKMGGLGDQTYQDAGFTITGYEDGTEYAEGKEPTEYAIASYLRAPEIGAVENKSDVSSSPRDASGNTTSGADTSTISATVDATVEAAPES